MWHTKNKYRSTVKGVKHPSPGLKRRVKERDRMCVICHCAYGGLEVSHINPYGNNDEDNLVLLCHGHHVGWHRYTQFRRRGNITWENYHKLMKNGGSNMINPIPPMEIKTEEQFRQAFKDWLEEERKLHKNIEIPVFSWISKVNQGEKKCL